MSLDPVGNSATVYIRMFAGENFTFSQMPELWLLLN